MKKEKNKGGAPLKYGEKTVRLKQRQAPKSKKEEIETKFDEILETYKKKL